MTLDLDNMTQAEFDEVMAEIKAKRLTVLLNADLESYKQLLKGADEYV